MRCFIAIELPPGVQETLDGPLAGLAEVDRAVRRNLTDRIHLTLHFLGEVASDRVDTLSPLIAQEAAGTARFELQVRGMGAYPSMARPQILWAGITGDEVGRLMDLQGRLGRALSLAGFPIEDRPYAPHLTLGRLRRPAAGKERGALARWQQAWSARELSRFVAHEVSLMRSELSSGPPQYTRLEAFPLQ